MGSAALSLVRRATRAVVAITVWLLYCGCSASTDEPPSRYRADNSWRYVVIGATVYTGNLANGRPAGICRSAAAMRAQRAYTSVAGCFTVETGSPATVTKVFPAECGDVLRCFPAWVRLRADGKWSGYTLLGSLQPSIVRGTVLHVSKDWSAPLVLYNASFGRDGVDLGTKAFVRVLRYDPVSESRTLYVSVLTGRYTGRRGWIFIQDVDSPDADDGLYGLIAPIITHSAHE